MRITGQARQIGIGGVGGGGGGRRMDGRKDRWKGKLGRERQGKGKGIGKHGGAWDRCRIGR